MNSQVLTDIKVYLKDALAKEQLSCSAEKERQRLVHLLQSRECSPAPYIDMSQTTGKCTNSNENDLLTSQCYEELSDTKSSMTSYESLCEKNRISDCSNNLYYNIPDAFKSSSYWDVTVDRPSVPTKETRSCLNSAAASARNSICSLTTALSVVRRNGTSDSSDAVSESSSSSASHNTDSGSPRTSSSSGNAPEVLTVSASALRYSAAKCGLLSRKEKFLFLDHYKQYWVALVGHVLHVYTSDKDSKPILEIDIQNYQSRPVSIKDSPKKDSSFEIFCPGSKTYQFTAPCALEMDQWIAAISQAGRGQPSPAATVPSAAANATANAAAAAAGRQPEPSSYRQLPSIPPEQLLMYDQPDALVRPVTPRLPEQYETMQAADDSSDAYYHCIDDTDHGPLNEGALYKNLEEIEFRDKEWSEDGDESDENLYYNLISTNEDDRIYDTISGVMEQKQQHQKEMELKQIQLQLQQQKIKDEQQLQWNQEKLQNQGEKEIQEPQIDVRTVPVSGRIQQIIQKIEEAAGTVTKTPKIVQDELYEPVDTREEHSPPRTVSR